MTTLVTGGSGYLGRFLVEALVARGRDVRVLARAEPAAAVARTLGATPVPGDVTDPGSLAAALDGVARVFHLAGVVGHRRREDARLRAVNVDGAANLLEAATAARVERVVFASSVATLGPAERPSGRRDESDRLPDDGRPEWRYARSKAGGEARALAAAAAGLDVVIALPGFVIGPGDVNRVSSWPVEEYLRFRLPLIVAGGLSYVDARDVVAGLLALEARGQRGRRYILTNDEGNLPYRDFFALVGRVAGRRRPTAVVPPSVLAPLLKVGARLRLPVPLEDQELRASAYWWFSTAARARAELGFETRPLAETVGDTIRWLRADGYRRH